MITFIQTLCNMFLSSAGTYPVAGMFTWGHGILFLITVFIVYQSIRHSLHISFSQLKHRIHTITIMLWILECAKIIFQFHYGNFNNLNTWVPLYFCSIALYAGLFTFSHFPSIQRLGYVFLETGGLIGGICFLFYPSSSLLLYPAFHFLSIHSFFYHGTLIYIGLMLFLKQEFLLNQHDFKHFSLFIAFIALLAWIINAYTGSNLMFISTSFPGTFLDILHTRLKFFYTPFLITVQMTLPFLAIYFLQKYVVHHPHLVMNMHE